MYRIGIDLGGTNIAVAIVDEKYKIVKKISAPTGAERGADEITEDMASLCHRVCREANIDERDIEAIGIASPGIADFEKGTVEYSNNLPFRSYPICERISNSFGGTLVHVENDANAAAWGEAVAGAADDNVSHGK